MAAIVLSGLKSQEYEHPDDAAALNALRKMVVIEAFVKQVSGWGLERMLRIQTTGSFLRVTTDNLPEIWTVFATARDRLSLPFTPELYIRNDDEINAFTAGAQRPVVVINSGAVDNLDEKELLFVIAHEMGHIKSGHVLYYQIANYFPVLADLLGDATMGFSKLVSVGMQYALLHWQRTSELTADRAGLLACQDPQVAFRAMMKLAGFPRKYVDRINVDDFLAQAEEFEAMDQTTIDKVAKYLSISEANHPWTVMRAKELLNWIKKHGYERVLNSPRDSSGVRADYIRRFCEFCGAEAMTKGAFCDHCGRPLLVLPPGRMA